MELLDGTPLDKHIARLRLELQEFLDLAIQIADALDAAHSKGIIHRICRVFVCSGDRDWNYQHCDDYAGAGDGVAERPPRSE